MNVASNVYFDSKGKIKVVGYKSFRGMVSLFKKINKNLKKQNLQMKFEITLPMKD